MSFHTWVLYVGSRDLSSGPHASSTTLLSLQPQKPDLTAKNCNSANHKGNQTAMVECAKEKAWAVEVSNSVCNPVCVPQILTCKMGIIIIRFVRTQNTDGRELSLILKMIKKRCLIIYLASVATACPGCIECN